jgi:hypothetical protein
MKRVGAASLIPPPACGGEAAKAASGRRSSKGRRCFASAMPKFFIWAGRVGGATTEAVLGAPESELRSSRPPRPPLPDDAAHRRRSADPPHKRGRDSISSLLKSQVLKKRTLFSSYAIALRLRGRVGVGALPSALKRSPPITTARPGCGRSDGHDRRGPAARSACRPGRNGSACSAAIGRSGPCRRRSPCRA